MALGVKEGKISLGKPWTTHQAQESGSWEHTEKQKSVPHYLQQNQL